MAVLSACSQAEAERIAPSVAPRFTFASPGEIPARGGFFAQLPDQPATVALNAAYALMGALKKVR